MGLGFPRDLYFAMHLGPALGWTDLTSRVRQADPVTIRPGSSGEQNAVSPTELNLVLQNPDGAFTPGNPLSPYRDGLKTYAQCRLGLTAHRDDASGTASNGWGRMDAWNGTAAVPGAGEQWTVVGTASDYSRAGGVLVQSVSGTNQFRVAYGPDDYLNSDQSILWDSSPVPSITGAPVEPANLVARYQVGTGDHYLARVRVLTDQSVTVTIAHSSAGDLVTPVTVAGLVHTGGNLLRVRLACEAQTLHAKVWDSALPEPLGWHVGAHDERITTAGRCGVRSGVASGNTNTLPFAFRYGNYRMRQMRCYAELADLKPRWNANHRHKTAGLQAFGIMRRIGAGSSPAESTMRRAMRVSAVPAPIAYWPCEDPANSDLVLSGVNGPPMTYDQFPGRPQFAASNDFVCSAPALKLNNAVLRGAIGDYAVTGQSQFRFLLSVPANGEAAASGFAIAELYGDGSVGRWQLVYTNGGTGQLTLNAFNQSGTNVLTTGTVDMGIHGVPKRVSLELTESGGNVNWNFSVIDLNGSAGGISGTLNANTVGKCSAFAFNGGPAFKDTAVCHAYFQNAVLGTGDLLADLIGRRGEAAGNRGIRLGRERGITYDFVGDANLTQAMGPQGVDTVLGLFQACADADQGILYETTYALGLALRHRRSLNQPAAVTLDYSGRKIYSGMEPALGDRFARNDVRLRRSAGGEFRAQQLTGPNNVGDPGGTDPQAIGTKDASITANLYLQDQLAGLAWWILHVGTSPELRFPSVTLHLRAPDLTQADQALILGLTVGSRWQATNLQAADVYLALDQLVRGYTEVIQNQTDHRITLNTSPARPHQTGRWSDGATRWASSDATLSAAILTTGALSMTVATTTTPWTTDPTKYPQNLSIEGEVVTVSAVSGASSPQTFTLSARAVNGAAMTHPAGARVLLADQRYWGV